MPVYACKCECGHTEDVFRKIEDHGEWPDHCNTMMSRYITTTNVMADMKEYRSPLDGTVVRSRKHHRDHMRKHGVIEVGNEKLKGKNGTYDPSNVRDEINRSINDHNRMTY